MAGTPFGHQSFLLLFPEKVQVLPCAFFVHALEHGHKVAVVLIVGQNGMVAHI